MLSWFKRDTPSTGSVLYRGSIPPQLGEFAELERRGISVERRKAAAELHWHLQLSHAEWGEAEVLCGRVPPALPALLIEQVSSLTRKEKDLALTGESVVSVESPSRQGDVLRDRKRLLRYLRLLMSEAGVAALDHQSQLLWSRAGLDDELQHDAPLDVEALFCIHAVYDGEADTADAKTTWMHTHGLSELGAFDFDVLEPHESFVSDGADAFRAMAFASLQQEVGLNDTFQLAHPRGEIMLIDASRFQREAPERERSLREHDENHSRDRAVACEPARRGLFSFLRRSAGVRKAGFFSRELAGPMTLAFSTQSTELMAERARATLEVFASALDELRELEVTGIVKLAYETDNGPPDAREHLWFEVHEIRDDGIDATLANRPFDIEALKEGDRRVHERERLTDWAIMTPLGMITPRSLRVLRSLRDQMME